MSYFFGLCKNSKQELNLIDLHHDIVLLCFSRLKQILFLFLVSLFHYIFSEILFKCAEGLVWRDLD